ncbi:MAG: sulfatase-like hydrolase/transferase [Clostridia bacterium]
MKKKNIMIITVDQMCWRALQVNGNQFSKTPNINKIAENGVNFSKCYTACPLCCPSRASYWTSRYPHETGAMTNLVKTQHVPLDMATMGDTFRQNGYDTIHFGNCHDSDGLRGFEDHPTPNEDAIVFPEEYDNFNFTLDTYRDEITTKRVVDYFENYSGDKPFLLATELVNPHNICGWVRGHMGKHKDLPLPCGFELPPLPENFDFSDIENRPIAVQYICCDLNLQAWASEWEDETFRHYLAAYYYYMNLVDKQIGRIMDALEKSGEKDNTLIVFYSDHGDSMSARRRVTKAVDFYEEVTRVPLMFSGNSVANKTTNDMLTTTLDIFPTLCSYAGVEIPDGVQGIDLSNAIIGEEIKTEREYVVSQWHSMFRYIISQGRMLCTEDFKYTYYIEDHCEELFDLKNDPYEKINVAKKDEYKDDLEKMRKYFSEYLEKTKDPFMSMKPEAEKRWRSHKIGYTEHRGDSVICEENRKKGKIL